MTRMQVQVPSGQVADCWSCVTCLQTSSGICRIAISVEYFTRWTFWCSKRVWLWSWKAGPLFLATLTACSFRMPMNLMPACWIATPTSTTGNPTTPNTYSTSWQKKTTRTKMLLEVVQNRPLYRCVNCSDITYCSDITNTLVGISGETVPEGRNLRIYWPHSNHAIWWAVVLTFGTGVSHHTPPPVGVLAVPNNFKYSEYFYNN